jgi:hypothetical protein
MILYFARSSFFASIGMHSIIGYIKKRLVLVLLNETDGTLTQTSVK